MNGPFHELLRYYVEQYEEKHPEILRGTIATRCGLDASQLSHYISRKPGSRRKPPDRRERVIAIADGLELDQKDRNTLLKAANHLPDGVLEQILKIEPVRDLHDVLEDDATNLPSPDREALKETLTTEAGILVAVWRDFFDLRRQLYARHWPDVAQRIDRQLDEGYWALRRMAARYRARVSLLAAAAQYHVGAYADAINAVSTALDAARDADAPMLLCQGHVRLGDIHRSRGHYKDAEDHYRNALHILGHWAETTEQSRGRYEGTVEQHRKALRILDEWTAMTKTQQDWAAHWHVRTLRKLATLHLFEGQPRIAIPALQECATRFREMGSEYELSRTYFSLGWGYGHIGDWDAAVVAYRDGLVLTQRLAERRGEDPRQLAEAHLCLAGIHWQRGELASAEHHLDEAQSLLLGDRAANWNGANYHEVGRYWLLRGRLHAAHGGATTLEDAREAFGKGIEFHLPEARRDPTRLASLHNALGLLEWQHGNHLLALQCFREASRWAQESDPPNAYYAVDVLVYTCGIELEREDDAMQRVAMIEEARNACLAHRYWRKLALLERYCAEDCARRLDLGGVSEHGARSLVAAIQFNRQSTTDALAEVRQIIMRPTIPEASKLGVIAAIGRQLNVSADELNEEQRQEIQRIAATALQASDDPRAAARWS